MTLKIKTPPMPEQAYWGLEMYGRIAAGASNAEREAGMASGCTTKLFTEAQLAARDAQWLALVGPVVEALADALESVVDYRHGMEFGTCDNEAITNGRAALRAITEEQE